MTATSVVCKECGSPVPYGRLSCPSCGTLLASVAGARPSRSASAQRTPVSPTDGITDPAASPPAERPSAPPPTPPPARPAGRSRVSASFGRGSKTARPSAPPAAPTAPVTGAGPEPAGEPGTALESSAPVASAEPSTAEPNPPVTTVPATGPEPVAATAETTATTPETDPGLVAAAAAEIAAPDGPAAPRPAPSVLRDWPVDEASDEAGSAGPPAPPATAAPGARSTVPAPGPAPLAPPATVAWPPAAWPPDPVADDPAEPSARPTTPAPRASAPPPPGPGVRAAAPTGSVAGSYLAPSAAYAMGVGPRPVTLPGTPLPSGPNVAATADGRATATRRGLAIPAEIAEWLSIGGSVLVVVSFVLPWATDGVIGSRGSGYTAEWGLANPGHLILIAATLAILILHLVPNRVPRWIRSGVLPLLVGGVLLGLAFTYYARPFGGGTGVAVELAGAVVLVVGGLLGIGPDRHEASPPGV